MLKPELENAYISILREELVPATGCTEPIAIAYAAARLRALLGAELDDFLAALEGEPALALRINPLRPGAHAAAAIWVVLPPGAAQRSRMRSPGRAPSAAADSIALAS